MLYNLKKAGTLLDSQKQSFLELVQANGSAFRNFYNNQVDLFNRVCGYYLDGLSEDEIKDVFDTMPAGSFTYEKADYEDISYQESAAPRLGFWGTLFAAIAGINAVSRHSERHQHNGHCNGDCANCPPHYGYRYGRWYYGHGHQYGCEFGGNKGDGSMD